MGNSRSKIKFQDTGPILLQRECPVGPDDTVDSLYNNFMYPEGIKFVNIFFIFVNCIWEYALLFF